jgi:hypothetical protein
VGLRLVVAPLPERVPLLKARASSRSNGRVAPLYFAQRPVRVVVCGIRAPGGRHVGRRVTLYRRRVCDRPVRSGHASPRRYFVHSGGANVGCRAGVPPRSGDRPDICIRSLLAWRYPTTRWEDKCCSYVYAFRREDNRALDWLQSAYDSGDADLYLIKGDPLVKNLEPDPRFKALLRKMNLPE